MTDRTPQFNPHATARLKHTKTCNGCKAFYQSQWRYSCDLGYDLKTTKIGRSLNMDLLQHAPSCGLCPKPMTYKDLFRSKHVYSGGAR